MKKMKKDALELAKFGIVSGAGSRALSEVGTAPASSAASAIGSMASFAPMMGTLAGAGAAVRQLEKINRKKRR